MKSESGSTVSSPGSDVPCERPTESGNTTINIALIGATSDTGGARKTIEVSWSGERPIGFVRISLNGSMKREMTLDATTPTMNGSERIAIELVPGKNTVSAELVDTFGYKYAGSITLNGPVNGSELNTITPTEEVSPPQPTIIVKKSPTISLLNPK
jgi:hypothetical protein